MNKSNRGLKYILLFSVAFVVIMLLINNATGFLKRIYPMKYEEYVCRYSEMNGIDPYLVLAIIRAESSFDPKATSHKNAKGLMQITDDTGKWGAGKLKLRDFTPDQLYDPEINIQIGCWYIKWLMKEFGEDVNLVVAAYNAGNGNVTGWLKDRSISYSGVNLDKIPFKETELFLKRVKNNYAMYKRLYGDLLVKS